MVHTIDYISLRENRPFDILIYSGYKEVPFLFSYSNLNLLPYWRLAAPMGIGKRLAHHHRIRLRKGIHPSPLYKRKCEEPEKRGIRYYCILWGCLLPHTLLHCHTTYYRGCKETAHLLHLGAGLLYNITHSITHNCEVILMTYKYVLRTFKILVIPQLPCYKSGNEHHKRQGNAEPHHLNGSVEFVAEKESEITFHIHVAILYNLLTINTL